VLLVAPPYSLSLAAQWRSFELFPPPESVAGVDEDLAAILFSPTSCIGYRQCVWSPAERPDWSGGGQACRPPLSLAAVAMRVRCVVGLQGVRAAVDDEVDPGAVGAEVSVDSTPATRHRYVTPNSLRQAPCSLWSPQFRRAAQSSLPSLLAAEFLRTARSSGPPMLDASPATPLFSSAAPICGRVLPRCPPLFDAQDVVPALAW
jgi:hypothetical protein